MPDDGQGALDLYIKTATGAACDFQRSESAESTRCSLFTSATDNITTQRRSTAILAPKSLQN
jgi:hypothetical protein